MLTHARGVGWAKTDFSQSALACFGGLVPSVWAHLKKVAGSFVFAKKKAGSGDADSADCELLFPW